MARKRTYYTLVQHSAWTGKRNPDFERAVEEWAIDGAAAMRAVVAAGGLIFNEYEQARYMAYCVNYPEGTKGIIPGARGTFQGEIDGQAIYVMPAQGATP